MKHCLYHPNLFRIHRVQTKLLGGGGGGFNNQQSLRPEINL